MKPNEDLIRRISEKYDLFLREVIQIGFEEINLSEDQIEDIINEVDISDRLILELMTNSIMSKSEKQIFSAVKSLTPVQFEHLVALWLCASGYTEVCVRGNGENGNRDGGVDITASIPSAPGLSPELLIVQCKHQKDNVQRTVIDELRGSANRFHARRGMVVTSSDFSSGARDAASLKATGDTPIDLVCGDEFIDHLIESGIGVKKQTIEILTPDSDELIEKINTSIKANEIKS